MRRSCLCMRSDRAPHAFSLTGSMVIGSVIVMMLARWAQLGKVVGGVF